MDLVSLLSTVVRVDQMAGEDQEETTLLVEMSEEARKFIASFSWCTDIAEEFFGLGIGGVVAVFLFRIQPARPEVDEWQWVVVGDLPPAYLMTDVNNNAPCALAEYVVQMLRWVRAVRRGRPVDHLIPVNVSPTIAYANMLQSRLEFLCEEVLHARHATQLKHGHFGRMVLKHAKP